MSRQGLFHFGLGRPGLAMAAACLLSVSVLPTPAGAQARPAHAARKHLRPKAQQCPANLTRWRHLLGAVWIDCHRVSDLTTTGNPWTDSNDLTGMGSTPPASGSLDSRYSNPAKTAVPGLQIDGYWRDGCNAFQSEPDLTNKSGQAWIPGCTPPATSGQTCFTDCHHDAQFVLRIPDDWKGTLVTAGTPGIRDQYSSDFIWSDYAMEKGWAYVSQDKGNMGANFYRDGSDEVGHCGTAWCPGAAIREWTTRMRQATRASRHLLYGVRRRYRRRRGVRYSYAVGISNGGYQVRRALETDRGRHKLYNGGIDWEGTLFTNRENLFSYLPTALAQWPGDVAGQSSAVNALAAVGFNPQSQPLWNYHWAVYWGLTQRIYRMEFDPEYTGYTCSSTLGLGPSCVSPPAETVAPADSDASYNYAQRLKQNPVLAGRMDSVANTGDIHDRLITLQGDQDSLLPIRTDADIYARMVAHAGKSRSFRFYTVAGGNHVDPQFDDHYGVDSYGTGVLRPILPCARAALGALNTWVVHHRRPPASHTIPRPANATASQLANQCVLRTR